MSGAYMAGDKQLDERDAHAPNPCAARWRRAYFRFGFLVASWFILLSTFFVLVGMLDI